MFPLLKKMVCSRNLLRQPENPASHSWLPSSMEYLALGLKRFRLEMLYPCGILFCPSLFVMTSCSVLTLLIVVSKNLDRNMRNFISTIFLLPLFLE